jgi:hypothetical protein
MEVISRQFLSGEVQYFTNDILKQAAKNVRLSQALFRTSCHKQDPPKFCNVETRAAIGSAIEQRNVQT